MIFNLIFLAVVIFFIAKAIEYFKKKNALIIENELAGWDDSKKLCPNCSGKINMNTVFCPHCGTSVK